jgi:hypothetical protein
MIREDPAGFILLVLVIFTGTLLALSEVLRP